MKYLIVGLGNIGSEYHETRHNIGFMVLDEFAKQKELTFESSKLGKLTEYKFKGRIIYFLKPNTYMNLSGKAVRYWMTQLKVKIENILVITDDLALPTGKIRLKAKGSSGGHNGLKNIEELLETQTYPRLRFGIGNDFLKGKQKDFVLNLFSPDEKIDIDLSIDKSIKLIETFAFQGIQKAMNNFN